MTLPTPRSKRLERVLAFWQELAEGRDMPLREQFSPTDLAPSDLPYVVLLTVHDGARDFTYRLVGSGVVDCVGEEFTGVRIADYLHMPEVPEMLAAYAEAVHSRRPTLFEGSLRRLDREHVRYERLAMPLADEDGAVCQLLAAFDFDRVLDGA